MIKIENDCCGCAVPGYPCLGDACPRRNTKVYYCDECGEEIDGDVYEDEDGKHFCEDCLLDCFRKVLVCDECGEEIDEAYGYEDEHFCKHCWLAKFRKEF